MTTTLTLLDELQQRGFTPDEDGRWFDLYIGRASALSGYRAKVRVALDDTDIIVYVMTGNNVNLWDVRLSGAPLSVVASVIDLAIARALTDS